MADTSKAERLAAARRKLQDFQRKKESISVTPSIATNTTPDYQDTPHSFSVEQTKQSFYPDLPHQSTETINPPPNPPIPSPFSHGTIGHDPHHRSSEVPSIIEAQTNSNGFQSVQMNEENTTNEPNSYSSGFTPISGAHENPAVFCGSSYFNDINNMSSETFPAANNNHGAVQAFFSPTSEVIGSSTAHLFSTTDDSSEKWDLNLSSAPAFANKTNSFAMDHEQPSAPPSEQMTETQFSKDETAQIELSDTSSSELVKEAQNHNLPSSLESEVLEKKEMVLNGCSSTENILQLSDKISQLIEPSVDEEERQNSTFTSSLETRNQKLAAQLAAERCSNQKLQFALKESQSQVSHLQSKVEDLQTQQEVVLARHLGPLQEQLRAHAQTVGILVGEKTELEAALAHHTATTKQHTSEVEELQSRLRASRHHVNELEKELITVTATASVADKLKNNHVQEVHQLCLQNGMLGKHLEDAEEEASELRQKLSARISEVGMLTTQLQETQSQLSLSQLRVTQLSASDNPEASAEIESLHQLKISLERRCAELTEAVRQISADRDQADQQYQQYVAQLNSQLQAANSKIESISIDNEKLKTREEDLVQNMSGLERQLQQQIQLHQLYQQQHNQIQQSVAPQAESNSNNQPSLQEKIVELEEERQRLQSSLDSEAQELGKLRAEIEEKDARIADLESLCDERPDQSRLLAAMESDKVAAAQATSQNTVLKQQLHELQDGFIKMSNDKLNLTESLEHEKHVNKELGDKISQLAEELHELRVLVSDKERRLQEYREHEHSHEHDQDHHKCNDEHNHEQDHNHHDSSHGHKMKEVSMHIHEKENSQVRVNLQEQLKQANEHIYNLNSQNNNLRRLIAQKSTESHESGSSSSATEGATTDDAAADQDTNCEDHDGHANYRSMQYAMEKLQERFTRTMGEVAELSDEKQRLEHLVLQLQGETETIGEYVALYQMQRAALQQRAREKDHQLATLSAEREELRRKLQELNQLVQQIADGRGAETAVEALSTLETSNGNADNSYDSDIIDVPTETGGQEANVNKDVAKQLTKQILSIIEDIGVTNEVEASFHPCPWCSGRLKNV